VARSLAAVKSFCIWQPAQKQSRVSASGNQLGNCQEFSHLACSSAVVKSFITLSGISADVKEFQHLSSTSAAVKNFSKWQVSLSSCQAFQFLTKVSEVAKKKVFFVT
jgi:hypothetical protein